MTCTRVLHALSQPNTAGLTVDLAKHLTQRQPFYQLLSMAPLNPTHCLHESADCPQSGSLPSSHLSSASSSSLTASTLPSGLRSCLRRYGGGLSKKRVVFADTKGLALTDVRLFVPEPSSPTSTLMARAKPQLCTSSRLQHHRPHLVFPQPTLDFKEFLSRERHIQLGSCCVSENSFSGTVYTSNSSAESAVHVRVTFDSWRSHHDIPCMFLQQQRCGVLDVNVFTFDVSLPPNVDPKERIEFCVLLRPTIGSMVYFDDNRGLNYRLHMEKDGPNTTHSSGSRYYATLSKYRPPFCPPNFITKVPSSISDWSYVQRSPTNNGNTECKTSVLTKLAKQISS